MKDLETLSQDYDQYDDDSQRVVDSLRFIDKEISEIDSMKRTQGWKIIEKKTREELMARITKLTENDPEVKILLALLNVADTKTQRKLLEEETKKLLPETTG